MRKLLQFVLRTKTLKHIIVNLAGTYTNIFFVALFALVIVRLLNPADYGVFSVLFGLAYVLANVLDLGVTASIYSSLPAIYQDKLKLRRFVKAHFVYQSLVSFSVVLVLVVFFEFFDKLIFKTGVSYWEIVLLGISIVFFVWQSFLLNLFLAVKQTVFVNLVLNISNVVKAILLFGLIFVKKATVANLILILGIIGPLVVFLIVFWYKREAVLKSLQQRFEKKQLNLSYILSFFIATQIFTLASRVDLFAVSYYLPKEVVGFYGLAQKVGLTVLASVTSITQILSPQFAKVKGRAEFLNLAKRSFFYLLIPSFLYLLVFLTPDFFYELFFTSRYAPAFDLIRFFALSYIVFPLANMPFLAIVYTFRRPKFLVFLNLFYLGLILFGCWLLIPVYGVWGALYTILFANLVGFAILAFYVWKKVFVERFFDIK